MTGGMQRRLNVIGVVVAMLALVACGGDDNGDGAAGAPQTTDDATAEEPDPSDDEDSEAPPSEDGGAEPTGLPDGADGILELGGETFVFRVTDTGSCETDFIGTGAYRALLSRFDGSGERMTYADGLNQGATFMLLPEGVMSDATSAITVTGDVVWRADPDFDERAGVDELTIEGDRAFGSATFVSDAGGGPTTGTFELVCGGG